MIQRFSSRQNNLGDAFFKKALEGAISYDRIAGYFSSSIIEIAGEQIERMKGKVRIVCNSQLQEADVRGIKDSPLALKQEWCSIRPEEVYGNIRPRLAQLYKFLKEDKMEVRVLPNDVFGLIHGKAGVITQSNGHKIAFMGSMNETYGGWGQQGNYEIAWVDDDAEAVAWVNQEFEALWGHPLARGLTAFIIEDIQRISKREVIYSINAWRSLEEPAATFIESPVYRREYGLWEHQKYFIKQAYDAHKYGQGARFILADMVGLGKTIQLALSAMLMALEEDNGILVIAPKTLIWQWQEELRTLLDMPSAVWNGKCWVDEKKIEHPSKDENALIRCPRKVGILSQGLIVRSRERVSELLLRKAFACVIVDEAHRCRRKNMTKGKEYKDPIPNNLMEFLYAISPKTKSMLLATATPVQIHPMEAWDLLSVLAQGNEFVLGNQSSNWRKEREQAINLITGKAVLTEESDKWEWIRNPLPSRKEDNVFERFRRKVNLKDDQHVISINQLKNIPEFDKQIMSKAFGQEDFIRRHNPFIRHIIRRERKFLEETINPETNQPYLKPIKVELYGEEADKGVYLFSHLGDAYRAAEEFSLLIGERIKASGFIKTLLLRRICSSMYAGLTTSQKMLGNNLDEEDTENEDTLFETEFEGTDPEAEDNEQQTIFNNLTPKEIECLQRIVSILEQYQDNDPKYNLLKQILTEPLIEQPWHELGCIVFSQYYDTIKWVCEKFAKEFKGITFGIYAGSDKSGIYQNGEFCRKDKEVIKKLVRSREIKLIFGTDAASEGLNLQTLGTLINLDLPWNPTRLEQRKGRIQRIGQERDRILIYNMRYQDSVEDRVHKLLSERLKSILDIFGQIPDTLEDVWVNVALQKMDEAEKQIKEFDTNAINPFYQRYQTTNALKTIKWEECYKVLDNTEKEKHLSKGW